MDMEEMKSQFLEALEAPLPPDALRAAATRCASTSNPSDKADRLAIAATLAHVAFLEQDRIAETYDALAAGWSGTPVDAAPIYSFARPAEPSPEGLWDAYWGVVEDGKAGKLDALSITARTAELGKFMTPQTLDRIAEYASRFEGVDEAAAGPMPELITLETLAACPKGSLGRQFHDLIVDNKFDLEVLDRDAIGLSDLPQPLAYLNTRMLQAHDLWHITGGYETTALHEIAISAFQMAQFGHNYSAQFLSITAVLGADAPGPGYAILMDTITSAWRHGRQSPALILIPWEDVWHQPVETIRGQYSLTTYDSPHPPGLIERGQAISQKLERVKDFVQRFRRGLSRTFNGGTV
ncbi:Coq4 family protein [Henriciella marina]|uniref:Coq4 family protein n=1 Tax=Henriciella marina TaxID=453851 RepID=A0ABT4LQR7_9PROT|nr:Coq4 family protein [Henriciella marina]MCZ4296462.1 Coq4 family protein [Henriciella marina]